MSLVYIGIFMMAIAFAIVSIFSANFLLRTSTVMTKLGETLNEVEKKLDTSIVELEGIISKTENTATDVATKLHAVNGLFLVVQDVGQTTEIVSKTIQEKTKRYNQDGFLIGTKPFISAIQLGEFGFGLVKSWTKGRKASS